MIWFQVGQNDAAKAYVYGQFVAQAAADLRSSTVAKHLTHCLTRATLEGEGPSEWIESSSRFICHLVELGCISPRDLSHNVIIPGLERFSKVKPKNAKESGNAARFSLYMCLIKYCVTPYVILRDV